MVLLYVYSIELVRKIGGIQRRNRQKVKYFTLERYKIVKTQSTVRFFGILV